MKKMFFAMLIMSIVISKAKAQTYVTDIINTYSCTVQVNLMGWSVGCGTMLIATPVTIGSLATQRISLQANPAVPMDIIAELYYTACSDPTVRVMDPTATCSYNNIDMQSFGGTSTCTFPAGGCTLAGNTYTLTFATSTTPGVNYDLTIN